MPHPGAVLQQQQICGSCGCRATAVPELLLTASYPRPGTNRGAMGVLHPGVVQQQQQSCGWLSAALCGPPLPRYQSRGY